MRNANKMIGARPHVAGGFAKGDATRNRPPGLAPKAVRRQKEEELLERDPHMICVTFNEKPAPEVKPTE